MDYLRTIHAQHHDSDCRVIVLRCHDKVQFDSHVMARSFAGRSRPEADDMFARILESIAYWLDVLQDGPDDAEGAGKAARRIALVAAQIGLTGLAVAAVHVGACLQSGDRVALAATIGRLERAFDLAVAEVWEFRDL